jgi:hypothetical protein
MVIYTNGADDQMVTSAEILIPHLPFLVQISQLMGILFYPPTGEVHKTQIYGKV